MFKCYLNLDKKQFVFSKIKNFFNFYMQFAKSIDMLK